jgi:hypothetical protein
VYAVRAPHHHHHPLPTKNKRKKNFKRKGKWLSLTRIAIVCRTRLILQESQLLWEYWVNKPIHANLGVCMYVRMYVYMCVCVCVCVCVCMYICM